MKATIVQTNFTAGELSPRMYGRVDVERYRNGARLIENCLPLIHGGCKTSPMLEYLANAQSNDRKSRLIRFEFSKDQANVLEFGHNTIRFYNQDGSQVLNGLVPYEISTVFDESELFELEYLGGADTIFIFHESHPVQRLRRFASDDWMIEDAPFIVEPYTEQGHRFSSSLTLSDASIGNDRVVTASSSTFLEGDIGRYISSKAGLALITGFTNNSQVTCSIESAFISTSIAPNEWVLDGSPQLVCQPSDAATIGSIINLNLSSGTVFGVKQTIDNATFIDAADSESTDDEIRFQTAANHGIGSGQIVQVTGCTPFVYNGTYRTLSGTNSNRVHVKYGPNPGSISTRGTLQTISTSSSDDGFRPEDVGKFVKINGGLCKITTFINATQVEAEVFQELSSDAAAQKGSWSLNSTVWNAENGYPRSGTFYQQRLIVGGSTKYPHTVYASRTSEFLNFELGVDDDDGFSYEMDATEYNPILHLASTKRSIIVLTSGGEFAITGGVEKPLTPTNIQIDNPTDYGSNSVKPIRIGNDINFFQRGGLKLRSFGYRLESDDFGSPDLTKLSEHITKSGIVDMAYQSEPESILWCVRADGTMVTLAIDLAENVVAWSRQVTPKDGAFEAVCVIPDDVRGDQVWCVVRRTIGDQDVRYIERYDNDTDLNLHSAVSGFSVTGRATWSGLDHLEGQSVEAVADGSAMGEFVVNGGQVTLPRNANQAYFGLPLRPKIVTLRPEIVTQTGSSQSARIKIGKTIVRVLDTFAMKVNGQFVDDRRFGTELLNKPPPSYSGDFEITNQGWDEEGLTTIEAANALPFHLLAVIRVITVNNG